MQVPTYRNNKPHLPVLIQIKYVSHDTRHFRRLDVHCLLSEFLGKRLTLAAGHPGIISMLHSPFLWPHVMVVIFGMLLMSELEGIPSCWMLGPISLKTQHQKWDTWKWLTQWSPEFRHFNQSTMLDRSMFITDGGILKSSDSWKIW